jgi:hypothetical protein
MTPASLVGLALVATPPRPVAERVSVSSSLRVGASLACPPKPWRVKTDARPLHTSAAPIRMIPPRSYFRVFSVFRGPPPVSRNPCLSASIRG